MPNQSKNLNTKTRSAFNIQIGLNTALRNLASLLRNIKSLAKYVMELLENSKESSNVTTVN